MNLLIDQVVQLEHVHVAHGDGVLVRLAGPAIEKRGLTVLVDQYVAVAVRAGRCQQALDLVVGSTVEDRGGGQGVRWDIVKLFRQGLEKLGVSRILGIDLPTSVSQPAQVQLKNLADVHTTRHTVSVQQDVHRSAVLHERHILWRQNLAHNTLVAVAAGHLIAVLDLALLRNVDADHLVDARCQVVIVIAGEASNTNDLAHLTVRNLHGGIAHLAGLLTEDGAQQALFRSQLGLTLRGDLTHQDIAGTDVSTDADDAALIEVAQDVLGDVWNLAGDFLSAQLGVTSIDLVLLNVD